MADPYILVWTADTSKCIGVADQITGAPLGLYPRTTSGATIVWNVDFSNNVIFLNSASGQLAVDFQGGKAGSGVPLVLSAYNGTPTATQKWSFLVRPQFITSLADSSLVIDDQFRNPAPGTPVWGYTFNGSPAQQWQLKSPFSLAAA